MDTQNRDGQYNFLLYKYLRSIQTSLLFSVFLFNVSACLLAAEKYTFEAESAKFIGEANKASDGDASGGYLVDLIKPDRWDEVHRSSSSREIGDSVYVSGRGHDQYHGQRSA